MRDDTIENPSATLVPIEAVVEIRAQQPPALGGPEGDGAAEGAFRDIQRLRRAVLEHGNRIANRRQPQSRQRRVFGHVDHVVYSAGLEAAGEIDGGRILDDAVPVLSGELPFLPGNGVPFPAHPVTYREHVAGIRRVSHRIGNVATVPKRIRIHLLGNEDVASHQALDRLARVRGHRRVDPQQAVVERRIVLPADPQEGESLLEKETVAVVFRGQRVARCGRTVEPAERRDPSPVGDVEEHRTVTRRNVLRFDKQEIRREFHPAGAVGRCVVDIGDDPVGGIRRIHGEVNPPGHPLVSSGGSVTSAVGHVVPTLDVDPDHLGRNGRNRGQQDYRYHCASVVHFAPSVSSRSLFPAHFKPYRLRARWSDRCSYRARKVCLQSPRRPAPCSCR